MPRYSEKKETRGSPRAKHGWCQNSRTISLVVLNLAKLIVRRKGVGVSKETQGDLPG